MRIKVAIDRGAGMESVTITPAALVGWERHTKKKLASIEKEGAGIEDLAYMVFAQLKMSGAIELGTSFDAFLETLLDVEPDETAPDPTPPAEDLSNAG